MRDEGTKSIPLMGGVAAVPLEKPDLQPREGLRLGRYELLVPIARGGMAEVWTARLLGDLGFSRIVALKTIRPDYAEDPTFRKHFFEEARIAARLRHANVVEVVDLGEQGPILFQAMTLIEGDSAIRLLRHYNEKSGTFEDPKGLPLPVAVRIMTDALAGLHAAHELVDEDGMPMRLIHRDVSPHNILVGIDGVAKLSDFGIAKALGRLVDETEVGQLRGKFGYLSPEQIERKPLDRRSDVFAAGVVLWEILTGRRLFRGDDALSTLANVARGPIANPRTLAPHVPEEIAQVTLRALTRDRERRYQTAAEMGDALDAAARGAGVTGSAKELAAFVIELCGGRIEEQRAAIRRARGDGTPAPRSESKGRFAVALRQTVGTSPPREPTPNPKATEVIRGPRPAAAAPGGGTASVAPPFARADLAADLQPTADGSGAQAGDLRTVVLARDEFADRPSERKVSSLRRGKPSPWRRRAGIGLAAATVLAAIAAFAFGGGERAQPPAEPEYLPLMEIDLVEPKGPLEAEGDDDPIEAPTGAATATEVVEQTDTRPVRKPPSRTVRRRQPSPKPKFSNPYEGR